MSWHKPLSKKHEVKKDRYGDNRKKRSVFFDGYRFDSNAEKELYIYLKLLAQAGEFSDLKCQDNLKLSDAKFIMKPDFRVTMPNGEYEWHEMKGGIITDQFKRNTRLWLAGYGPFPGAKLTVWKYHARRGVVVDKIIIDPRTK